MGKLSPVRTGRSFGNPFCPPIYIEAALLLSRQNTLNRVFLGSPDPSTFVLLLRMPKALQLIAVGPIGARLCWAREQRELKQYWLAEASNVESARLSRIERGAVKRLFVDELYHLARVLRCSLDWLIFGGAFEPWLPGQAPVFSLPDKGRKKDK